MPRKIPHQWLIEASDSARRQLSQLPSSTRKAVFRFLGQLLAARNPLAVRGTKQLEGYSGLYRFRAGDYRVLFVLEGGQLTHQKHTYRGRLRVLAILHRSRAYRP